MLANPDFSCKISSSPRHRAVAQSGSALRSGRRGRRFESCQLDSICISGCRLVRHFSVMSATLAQRRSRHNSPVPLTRETVFPFARLSTSRNQFGVARARIMSFTTDCIPLPQQQKSPSFYTQKPANDYVRSQQMVQD